MQLAGLRKNQQDLDNRVTQGNAAAAQAAASAPKPPTTEEVAARLRIRKQWLYQRVHARTLPFAFLKVGAYLRFSERAVEDYIRRQQEQTAGEQRRGR